MRKDLTERDRRRIAAAVTAFEKRTSGELVTIIAEASDEYAFIPILWAAMVALCLPAFHFAFGWTVDAFRLYELQLALFAALALLFASAPCKSILIPGNVKKVRAARFARQVFFAQGLHTTRNRAAILIFVSLAEHYVEILADHGIDEKVASDQWRGLVDDIIEEAGKGRLADGLLSAIRCCGDLLEAHFPPRDDEPDELPNELIEL